MEFDMNGDGQKNTVQSRNMNQMTNIAKSWCLIYR